MTDPVSGESLAGWTRRELLSGSLGLSVLTAGEAAAFVHRQKADNTAPFVSMRDYGSYMSALLKYTLVLPATLTITNGLRARQQTRILNVYLISRSEPI